MLRSSLTALGAVVSSATVETPGEDAIVIGGKSYPRAQIEAIRKTLPIPTTSLRPWEIESDEEKARREENELLIARDHYVYNIFKMFDVDQSGGIDAKEFKDLAYMLGETLTDEEVANCFEELDLDRNGTIEFLEFLNWWNREDVGSFGGYAEGFAAKLNLLKLRLQSRSYMRTVNRLLSRSLDVSKTAKESLTSTSSSAGDDESFTIDLQILSNANDTTLFTDSFGIKLERKAEDEQEYAINIKFQVREETDSGELNSLIEKLNGHIANLLIPAGLLPPGVNAPSVELVEDEGNRVLLVSQILPEDFSLFGAIAEQIDATLELTIDRVDTLTGDERDLNAPNRMRFLVKVPYTSVGALQPFLGPNLPMSPEKLVKLAKYIKVSAILADGEYVNKTIKEFMKDIPLPPGAFPTISFSEISTNVEESKKQLKKVFSEGAMQLLNLIEASEDPSEKTIALDFVETYYSLVKLLKGIILIEAVVGPKAIVIKNTSSGVTKLMPLFDYLPTKEDIEEMKK